MVRNVKIAAFTGAFLLAASPVFAQDIVQDMMKDLGQLDPTGTMAQPDAPAAAAEKPMMKKKMMKKKMGNKKMMMKKKKEM